MVLSDKCRKAAIANTACNKQAVDAANKDCAGVTGPGRGGCMNARFEAQLALLCGPLVCPNDPFMLKDSGTSTHAKTSTVNAGGGGGFQEGDQSLIQTTNFAEEANGSTGVQSTQMRNYILAGIAVTVLLVMATKRK